MKQPYPTLPYYYTTQALPLSGKKHPLDGLSDFRGHLERLFDTYSGAAHGPFRSHDARFFGP